MTLWLTSDQHYGHAAIIRLSGRPFADVETMGIELVRRHNDVVCDGDTVLHLGDFAWYPRDVARWLGQLRGTHILVTGNHDACFKGRKGWQRAVTQYLDAGFSQVWQGATDYIGGTWLSHLPPSDAEDPRYPDKRPVLPAGSVLFHGHVHERWRERTVGGVRCINVGVDVRGFQPVEFSSLYGSS